MAMATVQKVRWEGSRLPDQVLRCECGTAVAEIVGGQLRLCGLKPHHGEAHNPMFQAQPLDKSSK